MVSLVRSLKFSNLLGFDMIYTYTHTQCCSIYLMVHHGRHSRERERERLLFNLLPVWDSWPARLRDDILCFGACVFTVQILRVLPPHGPLSAAAATPNVSYFFFTRSPTPRPTADNVYTLHSHAGTVRCSVPSKLSVICIPRVRACK